MEERKVSSHRGEDLTHCSNTLNIKVGTSDNDTTTMGNTCTMDSESPTTNTILAAMETIHTRVSTGDTK